MKTRAIVTPPLSTYLSIPRSNGEVFFLKERDIVPIKNKRKEKEERKRKKRTRKEEEEEEEEEEELYKGRRLIRPAARGLFSPGVR